MSEPPPSYNQTVHGESAVHAREPTGVHGPMVREPDTAYLNSIGGIAKIVQAVSDTTDHYVITTLHYIHQDGHVS